MWYPWIALLVSCALVGAETGSPEAGNPDTKGPVIQGPGINGPVTQGPGIKGSVIQGPGIIGPVTKGPVTEGHTATTTRPPPRTLDRQAGELAWRTWLQSPEDGNQNAPPRRITTKSLFITPLVCPKGHRLDGTACVQVVTVNKADHERILLEQLNAHFTAPPNNGDVLYDYGDDEPGPLQLSIPIGLDPQASQDPSGQAQDVQPNYVKVDKKGEISDTSIEAELELLKLQQAHAKLNSTFPQDGSNVLSHNVLHNLLTYSDKPKRDSPMTNSSEVDTESNNSDEGQKEIVFGHVNIDPVLYDTENLNNPEVTETINEETDNRNTKDENTPQTDVKIKTLNGNSSQTNNVLNLTASILKKDAEDSKLNPENDYSDIGEAIKLISRYAEVSTDDNFTKDKKLPTNEDSILGTRTKVQYRRNKPKLPDNLRDSETSDINIDETREKSYQNNMVYYRYPWASNNADSPPPNYPFRHLQDYWPGRTHIGGVYNSHENPRRHHHSYPNYFRPRGSNYAAYPAIHPGQQEIYPRLRRFPHKLTDQNTSPIRSHPNNQDLYSLLGLRHWFSSEGESKR